MSETIGSTDDCRLAHLEMFANFVQQWQESGAKAFSMETFFNAAIRWYLLSECEFDYV